MLKQSLYTHFFKHIDNFYLFNSQSGLFCEISENTYIALYEQSYSSLDASTIEFLKEKKVLVTPDEEELYYLDSKTQFSIAMNKDTELGLVIMPTTLCNFNCPYCFESKLNSTSMSDAIENELFDFIRLHKNARNIKLTWYGGEPLLGINRIKKIWQRLRVEFPDKPITSHSIVTNGWLINDDIISFFKESNLDNIQITLDGVKEHHNETRCLRNGTPTFDTILNNIFKISERIPSLEIAVRVNINRKNLNDYAQVERIIKKEKRNNIYIYPGFIREDRPDGCGFCYQTISHGADYFDFFKQAIRDGAEITHNPFIEGSKGCMITSVNAYIIGPRGEIYKCWNDVGYPERVMGYLNDPIKGNRLRFLRYLRSTSPFSDSQCKECYVFPICKGGCGYYRYRNKYENGHFNLCSPFKDKKVLEESLLDSIKNQVDSD